MLTKANIVISTSLYGTNLNSCFLASLKGKGTMHAVANVRDLKPL